MGRATSRGRNRRGITIGDRSISVDESQLPSLPDTSGNAQLRQQLDAAVRERDQLRNRVDQLAEQVNTLREQMKSMVPLDEAKNAVRQAFRAGAERVIEILRNRGFFG